MYLPKKLTTVNCKLLTNSKGFTLIELMVAISIVAILAAIGLVVYSSAQKTARISKRLEDIKSIQTALELYKGSNGTYPISTNDLSGAASCINSTGPLKELVPNYMTVLPQDPSGSTHCYRYKSNLTGTEYKLITQNDEMTSSEYANQKNYLDPSRDGTPNCTIDPPAPLPQSGMAWAVYSSSGTDQNNNSCGF